MSIPTETLIVLNGNDKIGLSDTLDNYTIDDIKASGYVGCYDPLRTNCHTAERISMWEGIEKLSTPITAELVGTPYPLSHKMNPGSGAYTGAVFSAVVWLYVDGNGESHTPDIVINQSKISNYKLVTEMPANKMYYTVPNPNNWNNGSPNPASVSSWNENRSFPNASFYAPGTGALNYHSHYGEADDIVAGVMYTYPYMMYEFDGYFYFQLFTQQWDYYAWWMRNTTNPTDLEVVPFASSAMTPYTEDRYISLGTTYNIADRVYETALSNLNFLGTIYPLHDDVWAGPTNWATVTGGAYNPSDSRYLLIYQYGGTGHTLDEWYFTTLAQKEDSLLYFANSGVKIIADKPYKPIIENGVVTGITDDMTEPSELDEWGMGGTDHGVTPSGPPTPPPGPYDDDPWNGVSFSGVGVGGAGAFAKCYYMTSTELANLRSWMNSNNVPEGFDPMAQIIGLSQVPVSLSGDDNSTVQFVNSSAVYDPGVTRLVDSGVTTQIAMGTPIRYSLGSVDITRRMQERGEPYLDYDCQIELYLPLIGMFSLDTQAVMGRTITAEAVLDPISGTLAAYAYVSRDGQNLPIAYGSTTIGVDLPISSQQYSVSRAALKQANAQLGASILSSTLSFIAAATAGGKGSGTGAKTATGTTNGLAAAGIREAGADYMKASQAGNVFGDFMQWGRTIRQLSYGNNTAITGSFGGSTAQWSYPFTPYVKIIRPRYEKPSNYAHSQGVPCVQTKKVGSCTGFIQCIGVDVSGITRATDLERQAIQAALANGVFAGGGS